MTNPAVLRLSSPYRPEAEAAADCLRGIDSAIDWPAVAAMATPWLEAARREPAPFWAVETLLREYPISSAEGNALMRLAEALLRVPDRETAIALTADQLGRAAEIASIAPIAPAGIWSVAPLLCAVASTRSRYSASASTPTDTAIRSMPASSTGSAYSRNAL